MARPIALLVLAFLSCTDVSFAQGEYLGRGQSGLAVGGAYQSGRDIRVWSIVGGVCVKGKTDLSVAVGFLGFRQTTDLYSVRLRTFFKFNAERPVVLGSLDFTAQVGEVASGALGATGYANVWLGRASCLQVSFGPHLLVNPTDSRRSSPFDLMGAAGVSYLMSLTPHLSIALEAGGIATSGRYTTSSGGVGVNLIFPLPKP